MKYTPTKELKKKYISRFILNDLLQIVVLDLVLFSINKFLDFSFGINFIILMNIYLFLMYFYLIVKTYKVFDTIEIELTDTELSVKSKMLDWKTEISEIKMIVEKHTLFDPKQIVVSTNDNKVVRINSYVDNFDDLINRLSEIKPITKNNFFVKLLHYIQIAIITFGLVSSCFKNYILSIVGMSAAILLLIFQIIITAHLNVQKKRKIISLILYSLLVLSLIFNIAMKVYFAVFC